VANWCPLTCYLLLKEQASEGSVELAVVYGARIALHTAVGHFRGGEGGDGEGGY
jgi:hypothetical protein